MGGICKEPKKPGDWSSEKLKQIILACMLMAILVASPFAAMTKTFALLTPVADLTGQWSGFGQFDETWGCRQTVKLNAQIEQDGNYIEGTYSFVSTGFQATKEGIDCSPGWEPTQGVFEGTLDGSKISVTLSDDGLLYKGTYASSGIKLSVNSDWLVGTIQLSPTNFTPPPFEPKTQPPPTPPPQKSEPKEEPPAPQEEKQPTPPQIPDQEEKPVDDSAEIDKLLDEFQNEEDKPEGWVENKNEDQPKLVDIKDEVIDLLSQGKRNEALRSLDKIIENNPEDLFALHNKGTVLASLDRYVEALAYFEKALSVAPNDEQTQQAHKEVLAKLQAEPQFSVEQPQVQTEAKSYFTAGGKPAEVCNHILDKKEHCRILEGALRVGDRIITGPSSVAVIKLDGGKSTIYLGPNTELGVLRIDEKTRLFYLPHSTTQMKAEIHDPPGTITKFGMCTGEAEKCLIENLRYWARIGGTELLIEKRAGEQAKITVLDGHVGMIKGDEEEPVITLNTNNQIALEGEILPQTQVSTVDSQSIDRWWDEALAQETPQQPAPESPSGGGCLIATAAFGTELAPQVQLLREVRDNALFDTSSGTAFISAFNGFYYSFSPTISDWERQNPVFKEIIKIIITPMISTMSILSIVDIDSEQKALGFGIGIILLNIGMYFVAPAFVITRLVSRRKS